MAKLFVYGVHSHCPRKLIEEEFSRCGEVTDVYNSGKGFAFVTMADQDGVNAAIEKLNGSEMDGQDIKVEAAKRPDNQGGENGSFSSRGKRGGRGGFSRGGRGRGYGRGGGGNEGKGGFGRNGSDGNDEKKLFVYGVNARCPRKLIEDEFSRCGEVTDVYNTRKGFTFVTMAEQEGVNAAIEKLNGAQMDGQEIKVMKFGSRGGRGGRGGRGQESKNRGNRENGKDWREN